MAIISEAKPGEKLEMPDVSTMVECFVQANMGLLRKGIVRFGTERDKTGQRMTKRDTTGHNGTKM